MLPVALFIVFLLIPVLEIYVIIQVGELIGGWPTVALLLAESVLGAWIIRREGRRAWRALKETLGGGRMPDRELADAGLVLVGGALLLTPGFVTDFFGFLFVLPFTRPLVRRLLSRYAERRISASRRRTSLRFGDLGGMYGPGPGEPEPGPRVVRGEVIEEDREADRR
ncbi:FxsA family protein [Actinoallomurus soli]|uniref:FxsA family protein n=1 Tax=Actinoallomurus soli TaxID=2952535 RepID=UPI0020923D2C|nr:FxsA family protein [Actinoallomurus soli]MCO5972289.1 FxsA family protein [Actinoallomurus soli]